MLNWLKREHTPEAAKLESPEPIPVATATIVTASAVTLPDFVTDQEWAHRYEVERAIGADRTNPVSYFYKQLHEDLFDAGFVWIVKADFVRRFKYAGGVGGGIVSENPSLSFVTAISYVGDIPEFALDRMKVAGGLGIHKFSVHSAEPLRVERHRRVDPVMIGWYDSPAIQAKGDGVFVRCSEYCMGVVIAIWDGDKEIEVLG